ncbi:hypothetical protein AB0K12_44440 [Nonomuraea sp. NPDC049419]|uniref:hypothetical protein n=1 Tax=Nonomuraea sp. NPDC049419 TaxID=3155772 RepID=UPI0034459EB6
MSELPQESGDARVDAIVAGLARLGELPVAEHVAVFDEAFSGLESTLAAVEEHVAEHVEEPAGPRVPGPPVPGPRVPGPPAVGRP